MPAALLSLLISHILTYVESELIKNEPALVNTIEADIKSLIHKLENLLIAKSPAVAAALNPALDEASNLASDAVEAAGTALVQGTSTPQSAE